ncbi:MAG: ATP synthase F1 subunit gamma [Elusimicrobia bacterium]|nr:ATP synthase F1 subunit gamma [Elusimicrobiota bacterium]
MASLREIRRKIKSVKSTQQITKAMKMVSAARMRRAQSAILSSRPFAQRMEEAVTDLAKLEVRADRAAGREVQIHPYFDKRPAEAVGLLLVSADKGLCGSFNTNILRLAIAWLKARRAEGKKVVVVCVGRKGRDLVNRLREDVGVEKALELVGVFPKITFAHAELAAKPLLERYESGELASVTILTTEFHSVVSQKVAERPLLPIPTPDAPDGELAPSDFKFEPRREDLLSALLPRHAKAQIYRALLESQASELAARMNAMDSASKNAAELISDLTLWMNRTRQAIITRELMEIVSGAEALAQ